MAYCSSHRVARLPIWIVVGLVVGLPRSLPVTAPVGVGFLAIATTLLASQPNDVLSLGPIIVGLGLSTDQQKQLVKIASRHRGNLSNPNCLSEIEAILSPQQREKVRALLRTYASTPPPTLPDAPNLGRSGVFSTSFDSGQQDRQGRVLGGTEVVALVAHQEKLYAAVSVYKDNANRNPRRGAQILVLDRAAGPWKLDRQCDPFVRSVAAMNSFAVPQAENKSGTTEEDALLFVAPLGSSTKSNPIYYRKGHEGWHEVELAKHGPLQTWAFGFHQDRITGRSLVLVACQPGGIYGGILAEGGTIAWQSQPEFASYSTMPTGFASCNGALYLALGPNLYRRQDGSAPSWQRVFVAPKWTLRGLTSIPSPVRNGQVLLAAQDGNGRILRIDPEDQYQATTETTLDTLLSKEWGVRPQFVVAARHGILPVFNPSGAGSLHIFGIEARIGRKEQPAFNGWVPGGWIVIRRSPDEYELREIIDPSTKAMPPLVSVRAMALSPFENLLDSEIYCGGYNTESGPAHNTAWIYHAALRALLP